MSALKQRIHNPLINHVGLNITEHPTSMHKLAHVPIRRGIIDPGEAYAGQWQRHAGHLRPFSRPRGSICGAIAGAFAGHLRPFSGEFGGNLGAFAGICEGMPSSWRNLSNRRCARHLPYSACLGMDFRTLRRKRTRILRDSARRPEPKNLVELTII